jgi:DNA-binding MarR family transcriptional regulator
LSSRFTKADPADSVVGPPLIGALLRVPLEVVRRRMLERLHECGFDDLEAAHLIVLQYPGPQGMRPSDLAARLRISNQALTYQLCQLERHGYHDRQQEHDDLRSKRIVLTRRGHSAIPVIREAVSEVEANWARQLGPEPFAQLSGLQLELNQLAEAPTP